MGAFNSSMPPPDQHVLNKMEFAHFNLSEVKRFWSFFRKMDKNLSGTVELADFYKTIEERRSIVGDSIFELSDCNTSGTIDFSEFFCSIVTYCLFEREEILRFCFYIFDRDKNGYIEQDELKMMVNIMYGISPADNLKGNTRIAVESLEFNSDGKVDFNEFKQFNKEFPALFYPAFRIQVQMRIKFGGERFWLRKARYLQDKRDRQRARDEYTKRKEQRRLRKLQQRKIRKKMGYCRFMCCPSERVDYEELFPIENKEKTEKEKMEQEVQEKKKEREKTRREAELAIKNPETKEWVLYQKWKERKATQGQAGMVVMVTSGVSRQAGDGDRRHGSAVTSKTDPSPSVGLIAKPSPSHATAADSASTTTASATTATTSIPHHVKRQRTSSSAREERRANRRSKHRFDED